MISNPQCSSSLQIPISGLETPWRAQASHWTWIHVSCRTVILHFMSTQHRQRQFTHKHFSRTNTVSRKRRIRQVHYSVIKAHSYYLMSCLFICIWYFLQFTEGIIEEFHVFQLAFCWPEHLSWFFILFCLFIWDFLFVCFVLF